MGTKHRRKILEEVLKKLECDSSDSDGDCHSAQESFNFAEAAAHKDGKDPLQHVRFCLLTLLLVTHQTSVSSATVQG